MFDAPAPSGIYILLHGIFSNRSFSQYIVKYVNRNEHSGYFIAQELMTSCQMVHLKSCFVDLFYDIPVNVLYKLVQHVISHFRREYI
jgi:hypothetical protein